MLGRKRKDIVVVVDEPVQPDGLTRRDAVRLRAAAAIAPRIGAAAAAISPYAVSTRDRLVPVVLEARERVVPAVAGARDRVVPAVEGARSALVETVAPAVSDAVTTAVTAARESSMPTRTEARRRSTAALAALRGDIQEPQLRRRWPVALLSLLAGAGAGVAAGLLTRRGAAPAEPTYIPAATPPRAPAPSPAQTGAAAPYSSAPAPAPETSAVVEGMDQPVGTESDLGWPEELDEPTIGSEEPVLATDEVDRTLVEDSSETHKPTA